MKSLIQKFVALIFITSLATGCVSSLTAPQSNKNLQKDKNEVTNNNAPNNPVYGTDQDMHTVRDKPTMNGEEDGDAHTD